MTRLVTSPGVWVAPVALLVLASRILGAELSGEHYPVAVVAADVAAVALIAPLVALAGAWEGAKIRSARVLVLPRVRSAWRVALEPIAASVVPAALILVVFTAVDARARGVDWAVIAGGALTLTAWGVAGFGLGCLVPAVLALPLALLVAAVWLIYPRTIEPLWLRHLTGAWNGCCMIDQSLSPRAMLAAGIVAVGTAAAGGALVWAATAAVRRSRAAGAVAVGLALAALAASVVGGSLLVRSFGADPVVPRSDPTNCDSGTPALCLWPEHEAIRGGVRQALDESVRAWESRGVEVPARFDERLQWREGAGVPLYVSSRGDTQDWKVSFAGAMVATVACPSPKGDQATGGRDSSAAWAWLWVVAGGEAAGVPDRFTLPAAQRASELLADPDAATWVNDVIVQAGHCP